MLNHRQIEIFRTLIQTQNITQAAERFFTSQPTISRELARIEQLVGFILFERKNGRIHPTESALVLYKEVIASYVGLEKINQSIENLKLNRFSYFELCCQPFLSNQFITTVITNFLKLNPDIQLVLRTLETPFIESELSQQKFHLRFIESNEAPQGTESLCKLITQQVCILPRHHYLKSKSKLTLQDFHNENLISLSKVDPYQQDIDLILHNSNIQPIQKIEADQVHTICNMVVQGLGISIINPLTALEYSSELIIKPLNIDLPYYVNLVQAMHRPYSNLIKDMAHSSMFILDQITNSLIQNHKIKANMIIKS